MGYRLGVDLGTTWTAAAVARSDDAGSGPANVAMLRLGTRSAEVPTVVAWLEDDTTVVGTAAERRSLTEPARVARQFKRRLGDPVPLIVGGKPRSAESLMAVMLRHVVDTATAAEGASPDEIVLTHPANWGPYKIERFRQVFQLAGVPDGEIVAEPVAAARHYLREHHLDVGNTVAIFDFGGGTFDAALLRRTADGFEAVGEARGLEQLGGIDLDESILHHVLVSAAVDLGSLDDTPSNWAAVDRLRHECVAAKEVLSDDTVAVIPVMLPEVHTEVRLTRTEFESMIGPAIGDAVNLIEATIRDAGLEPSGVAAVLLVGGTSRIPLVNQLVAAQLQVPVLSDVHPKHAVAMGSVTAPVGGLLDRTLGPVSSSWPQPLAGGVEASASVAPTAEPDPTPVEAVAVTPAASGQYTPVGSGTGGVEQTSGGEAVVQPKGRWIFAAVVTALAIVGGLILLNRGSDPTDPGDSAATSPAVSSTIGDETTSSAPETTTLPETTTTEPTTTSTTGAPSPPSDGSGMLEWIGVDEIGQIGSPVSSSDGWFATPGPASLPTVAWETDIVGRAGTAAGGGMVFAMVPSGERAYELVAFDAASGARLWSDQPTGTCCTNLVLTDRTVATVTTDRGPELRFLERSSGALIDALPIDDLFTNLPADAAFTEFELAQSVVPHRLAIERGAAFVVGSTTGDGSFVAAIDLGTGTTRWSHYDPTTSVVPSVFLDASVVLVADTDSVTTLDIATGDVLWTTDALNRDRIEHLDAGVVMSIDEGYEANTGFDARSGVEVWAVQQRLVSDIASDGEQFIQLSASTGTLEARSIATGDLVWSVATSTAIDWGQLAIAGDLVYVVGRNGMVSAHALADGSVRWSGQVDGLGERDQSYVYLAVAEDRLAVVEDDLLRVTTAN